MNAHPEAQLKVVEILAMLANKGCRIIVTTHSPYFLDHLNNLMEGAALAESGKEVAGETKLHNPDAFISSDKVAAYLFGDDGAVHPIISDGVIDATTFANETDFLGEMHSRIMDARKTK